MKGKNREREREDRKWNRVFKREGKEEIEDSQDKTGNFRQKTEREGEREVWKEGI